MLLSLVGHFSFCLLLLLLKFLNLAGDLSSPVLALGETSLSSLLL